MKCVVNKYFWGLAVKIKGCQIVYSKDGRHRKFHNNNEVEPGKQSSQLKFNRDY